jgi:hypothetical protein
MPEFHRDYHRDNILFQGQTITDAPARHRAGRRGARAVRRAWVHNDLGLAAELIRRGWHPDADHVLDFAMTRVQ